MTETLVTPEHKRPPRPAPVPELGAAACAGCPLLKLGCPGKAEVAPCPPEAKQIEAAQVAQALDDDSIASVTADGAGGFVALPAKEKLFQTKPIAPPTAPPQKPRPKPAPAPKPEHAKAPKKNPDVLQTLGEAAALLVGALVKGGKTPAKK